MKKILIILAIIILIVLGVVLLRGGSNTVVSPDGQDQQDQISEEDNKEEEAVDESQTVLGSSVEGEEILAYHYGRGEEELLFVAGIHGGYSWNTTLMAYEMMDYLESNAQDIPENLKITVIPALNPDGLKKVVGSSGRFSSADVPSSESATVPGRFNANEVDLNRNFDCDWQTDAVWQSRAVSGGSAAFSEPEARAIRDYIKASNPEAVVVYYSAAGGVFASNCHGGVLAETIAITKVYAEGSEYPAYQSFDFYATTGDMVNWLAKEEIPAISVLLSNHKDIEWDKNRAGLEAMLEYYSR